MTVELDIDAPATQIVNDARLAASPDSAATDEPAKLWARIGGRICTYLKAAGAKTDVAEKYAREVIGQIAADADWQSSDHTLHDAMQEVFTRIASVRTMQDNHVQVDEDFIYVRICLWFSGIEPGQQSSCDELQKRIPLAIDGFGHVRLNSMPSIERLHMVPGDINHNVFHSFINRSYETED